MEVVCGSCLPLGAFRDVFHVKLLSPKNSHFSQCLKSRQKASTTENAKNKRIPSFPGRVQQTESGNGK